MQWTSISVAKINFFQLPQTDHYSHLVGAPSLDLVSLGPLLWVWSSTFVFRTFRNVAELSLLPSSIVQKQFWSKFHLVRNLFVGSSCLLQSSCVIIPTTYPHPSVPVLDFHCVVSHSTQESPYSVMLMLVGSPKSVEYLKEVHTALKIIIWQRVSRINIPGKS